MGLALLAMIGGAREGHALAICVDSKEVAVTRDECIRRGEAVMSKYFKQSQHDAGAVFGFQGKDDAAAILCDRVAKGIVFFSVASTDNAVCRMNILRLMREF